MKNHLAIHLIAFCQIFTGATVTFDAKAQSEASAVSAVSALPVASVVVGASAVAGAVVAVPVVLSAAGMVRVVKTVESTARGTVYVFERASDGARASIEVVGKGIASTVMFAGASVVVSVVCAGVVLLVLEEAIAFIPNALGRALLHNERLTY
ncbi:MAG: hypothetical protein H7228_15275 [Polaromonas sp.]|nr:hypothetical protein [Polaromonas sp.]